MFFFTFLMASSFETEKGTIRSGRFSFEILENDRSRTAIDTSCRDLGAGDEDFTCALAALIHLAVIHFAGQFFKFGKCLGNIRRSFGFFFAIIKTVGIRQSFRVDDVAARSADQCVKTRIVLHRTTAAGAIFCHIILPNKCP